MLHIYRYQRLGELTDLERGIKYNIRALDLTPDGHPSLSGRHANMGISYSNRYRRLGELADLEGAIKCDTRALDLTPADHPRLPDLHSNLGVSYMNRYQRLGELADLEKAIEYDTRALNLTPKGHPSLPHRCAGMGASYMNRYQRLGEVTDLEKAIKYNTRALDLTPDDHPSLSSRYANLGTSYIYRYENRGELRDLDKAIECNTRALDLTPDGHPDLPARHDGLGVSYSKRYTQLGKLADIGKAIEFSTRALDLTPSGHPDLSERHRNLGVCYINRYQHSSEFADLREAIECFSHALDLTPEGHPSLPDQYNNLGVSYMRRYRHLGELADLEKAIKYIDCGIHLTPDGHPHSPILYHSFALSSLYHYQHSREPSHLDNSLTFFRKASQLLAGAPRVVFNTALSWANLASVYDYLNPIEAFRVTIDLLPHFIWLGATTYQRYRDLSSADSLAVRAACAAIRSSEYTMAVEWLEHARCVVWNQSLMLRTPVDDLQLTHADLAAQLRSISQQLHHASSGSSLPSANSSGAHAPERRHRLAREYNELLQLVRKQPGFGCFLQPTKSDGLLRAARYGPIVIINCHEVHCDALIILPGQDRVGYLGLPNCTQDKAQSARSEIERLLQSKSIREREHRMKFRRVGETKPDVGPVLSSLWYNVVKPILEYLGYTVRLAIHYAYKSITVLSQNDSPINHLPHITWCPTGIMSFLPLHAAGDYDKPRSRVFDYVISSYTPTLSAMLTSTSTPAILDRPPRILAIGQAATPKCSPLPGTDKELEHLKAHAEGRAEYSQLTDDRATTTAVLDAMDQHDWVHLACHAQQNAMDPTKSGFYLHDGTLDLSAITQRSFRGKGLAFLSACQTARGDERLPDEVIHLASGMLMAGYPSVIGTMWSVVDEDAPFVADKVYAQLMENGKVGSGEAGKALHYAVAGLRDQIGEREFARWIPYIHIGS
ncbi:TPR-like protein, partial [Rhizoctonia solani]